VTFAVAGLVVAATACLFFALQVRLFSLGFSEVWVEEDSWTWDRAQMFLCSRDEF